MFTFCLRFSGITIRFLLPTVITLPDNFAPFRCPDTSEADEEYRVELLRAPLHPQEPMLHQEGEAQIYHTGKGWLHIYPSLGDEAGCQVACLFCPDGHHTIYYPASRWAYYSRIWRCGHLICGERVLLRHDAFLLHSSLVRIQGRAVLFSGPSNAGKSTLAQLWQTHLGAEILNGDRTVIMKTENGFTGSGSIWSGTSGIYRPEQAPIAGIFLLEKAPENRVERLHFQAFAPLFSQTILNSWDPDYMNRIAQLYSELLEQVPIYRLYCRADQAAVTLAYHTLFGKE
jgi:hypothetical protein